MVVICEESVEFRMSFLTTALAQDVFTFVDGGGMFLRNVVVGLPRDAA
jgi:hypothetical protein